MGALEARSAQSRAWLFMWIDRFDYPCEINRSCLDWLIWSGKRASLVHSYRVETSSLDYSSGKNDLVLNIGLEQSNFALIPHLEQKGLVLMIRLLIRNKEM